MLLTDEYDSLPSGLFRAPSICFHWVTASAHALMERAMIRGGDVTEVGPVCGADLTRLIRYGAPIGASAAGVGASAKESLTG